MSDHPLVSVIIPVYNAAAYIKRAIDSALGQTYPNLEIILIDDGSTDQSAALIQQHYGQDRRVRYGYQVNQGVSAARNRGVQSAQGEFVHFLDSDDWLDPTKIEKSYRLFESNPAIAVVYGHGIAMHPDGMTPIPLDQPPLPSGDVFCEWLTGTMAGGKHGVTPSFMVKRAAILEVGGFDPTITLAEDWDLWLRLAERYPFAALSEKLVYYTTRPDGLHAQALKMAIGRLEIYQKTRSSPRVHECLSDAEYDRLLAGRWHVVAMRHWEQHQRAQARKAFQTANRYDPSNRWKRRLFSLLTYLFPASILE
ncbi:MAG: glycosyltransferase family 2 protein [Anaerolineae bacterium]|nr:glycosyltransferase family 2 protein [Anaerolineae bacterium]